MLARPCSSRWVSFLAGPVEGSTFRLVMVDSSEDVVMPGGSGARQPAAVCHLAIVWAMVVTWRAWTEEVRLWSGTTRLPCWLLCRRFHSREFLGAPAPTSRQPSGLYITGPVFPKGLGWRCASTPGSWC